MKQITTYIDSGRTFYICQQTGQGEADGFWAFEDSVVDSEGRLTKVVNGIQGHHKETLSETLESVRNMIKVDALVAKGMDRMAAAVLVITGKTI